MVEEASDFAEAAVNKTNVPALYPFIMNSWKSFLPGFPVSFSSFFEKLSYFFKGRIIIMAAAAECTGCIVSGLAYIYFHGFYHDNGQQ